MPSIWHAVRVSTQIGSKLSILRTPSHPSLIARRDGAFMESAYAPVGSAGPRGSNRFICPGQNLATLSSTLWPIGELLTHSGIRLDRKIR